MAERTAFTLNGREVGLCIALEDKGKSSLADEKTYKRRTEGLVEH